MLYCRKTMMDWMRLNGNFMLEILQLLENTLPRLQVTYTNYVFLTPNTKDRIAQVPERKQLLSRYLNINVSEANLVPYVAVMSSEHTIFVASRCIDGVTRGVRSNVCHTLKEQAPWLLLDFQNRVEVTRVDIYNRADCCGERTRNLIVRLTDEVPTTGSTMYTGGQLLGTFQGPGTNGQVISVSGSAKIGRYVLIQMDYQQPLNLHEVFVFGRVSHLHTDCSGALQLDVVESGQGSLDELVHNLLSQDENVWLADEINDQGFVLRIRGCKRKITGLRIRNAAQPWSSKRFNVSGALEYPGPWTNLLEKELSETDAILTFHFSQPREVQFLRFELLSHYGKMGGGLKFFSPLAGSI